MQYSGCLMQLSTFALATRAALLGLERNRVIVEFRMGGVVRLNRNRNGEWAVQWVVTPELLPAFVGRQGPAAYSGGSDLGQLCNQHPHSSVRDGT